MKLSVLFISWAHAHIFILIRINVKKIMICFQDVLVVCGWSGIFCAKYIVLPKAKKQRQCLPEFAFLPAIKGDSANSCVALLVSHSHHTIKLCLKRCFAKEKCSVASLKWNDKRLAIWLHVSLVAGYIYDISSHMQIVTNTLFEQKTLRYNYFPTEEQQKHQVKCFGMIYFLLSCECGER